MAVKERVGVVVSDKMDKTVVVAIENRSPHPKYGKIVVKTQKFKAHDAENQANKAIEFVFVKPAPSVKPNVGKWRKY